MNRLQSFRVKVKEVLTILPVALLLGLGVVGTLAPQQVNAASSTVDDYLPSTGRDFWVTFMQNADAETADNVKLKLEVIAIPTASGTISLTCGDGTPLVTGGSLSAGTPYVYEIPADKRDKVYNTSSATKTSKGLHVETTGTDIALYVRSKYVNSQALNSYDMSPVFPIKTLGADYVIQSYWEDQTNTVMAVVATENDTKITIKPSCKTLNSDNTTWSAAGTTRTETLNKGQVYLLKGESFAEDEPYTNIAGTTVGASKPVAVFNGGVIAFIPDGTGLSGDHIFEQALPVHAWGKRFVLMNMNAFPTGVYEKSSSPTEFIITAIYPDTKVYVDGEYLLTLQPGESTPTYDESTTISVAWDGTPKMVQTSEPVSISGFMVNAQHNTYRNTPIAPKGIGIGEPSMVLIPDVTKGVSEMSYYCKDVNTGATTEHLNTHYANVIVKKSGVAGMRLHNGTEVVNISGNFTTLSQPFDGMSEEYAYARIQLTDDKLNRLYNENDIPFVATMYSVLPGQAMSEAAVATMNIVPSAPVMFVDDNEVVHGSTFDYCNKHPGVHFTAIVDYPHTGVKWELGEGAVSTDYEASHMYGATVGESDKKHDVYLYVFHETPITHVKDTDTVHVTLNVHPVYYDTLKTKVAANKMVYEWKTSSEVPFGLIDGGTPKYAQFTLSQTEDLNGRKPWIKYEKDSANAAAWTDSHADFQIFDSLVYATRHDCDSIFYLQLDVVPDIIMPEENASICQGESFTWTGHHNAWNHLTQDGVAITTINTAAAGTFVIRDTMQSLVFPYPDSIHILNLTVYDKPTIKVADDHRKDSICEVNQPTWTVPYVANYADSLHYWLKPDSAYDATRREAGLRRTTETSFDISTMSSLPDGKYKLILQAFNTTTGCISVTDEVPLVIKNRPSLKVEGVDPQCWAATAPTFTFSYTPVDAAKITYWVDSVGGTPHKIASTTIAVDATKKFDIATIGWPAGHYELYAQPISALGCDSTAVKVEFVINKKPTITITSTSDELSQCDKEDATTLKFNVKDANNYNYYIVGKTSLLATPVAVTDGDKEISLDISSISGLTEDQEFTLKMVANSATCVSDTAEATFTIYPMPTATITSLPADLNACAPGTSNKTVNYTTTNASQIKWQLTTPHGVMNYDYAAVGSSLTVLQDSLVCPGTYKVKITGVKSANNCEVLNPAGGEVTFTMYNPAAITLNDIAAVCAGNAVTSTYTAEYTDSYTYEVRRKTGNVLKGSGSSTTINGTIDLSKTDTLPAGTYVLSVTATNTNNCGSSSASKEFVINPIPVINSLSTPDNVCETEVASRDVSFTATDAANILYTLKKGSAVWNAENSVAVGAGKFSIKTDTLSAGDYTVEAKPVSGAGCTGAVKSVNFTVYPHPTVTLSASLPNACFGDESLTINYSTTYAATYAYTLADKDGNALTPGSGAAVASGSIVVPLTATMTAAKSPYKFRIEVTSDKGCKSGWVEKTFTIYPKPTAGITSVESKCDNETSAAVVYTSANATKYEYRVFKSGVAAPVLTVTDQDVTGTTFNVDISTLDAGSYELRLVVKSATCESDTAKKSFDIWPLPVISTLDNTTPCEGESVVNVPYTATNALTFSYTVKDGETVVKNVTTATVADGKIEVDIDGLTTGGAVTKAYTLSVTAKSEHDCETAAAKTATITLKAKPTVTLSSVTNTCAGTGAAITVAYTGLTTTKLDYIVRKGGVDTSVSGNKTGLTPEVDGSFVISGAELEALAAGTDYEVELIAQGDNGCPSIGVDQVKAFTIYPLPTVAVKSGYEEITVCEGREDAVFELTTSANASTYSYTTGALGLTATDQPVVDQKIKITLPKADLKDGDFTLTVTVKSAAPQSCTSVAATATLHVNNRPTLKIDDIAAQCYPISSFTVSYTPTDAKYVKWTVDNKITTEQTHTVPNAAPYQFTISTDGWAAGTYTLRAKPVSALDCDSAAVVKTFTINAKPELSNLHAYNECTNQFVNVFFDHNGVGNRIEWEVLGTTCHGEEDITNPSSGIAHIAPNSLPAGDYTFRGKMVNTTTGCESEPKDLNFTLWPRAEISLLKDSAFCYPANKSYVRYAAPNAASYTYRLTGHGIDSYLSGSGTMTSAGLIEVNTNGLEGGYAYTLTVTAASEHDCKSDEKTATITLYPQPAITSLAKVDSVCEKHSPSAIALTMTGAMKYNYEVLKEGESTPKEQKTGETSSSITLNTNAWAAGKYTLKVTAVSDLDCGSDVEERVFLIYPQPKVTALSDVTICETDAEASFSYTMTDAKTYTYDLKNSLDVTVASSATAQTASSSGSIKINTAELPDGTYTLHVTATSDKGCVSDEKTSTLTINNQPSVNMSAPAAQCHPASSFEVAYAPEDVKTFTYMVKQGSTMKKSAETITPTTAPYKFSFSTTGWAAGTYTIEAKAVSADNCDGKTETVNFTINKKPVISDLTTQNKCKGDAIQVSFNHDNVANGCNWEIVETGVTGSKAFTHDSPDGFPIATSAMDPGTYTLRVWVSNSTTTCTSEYAEKTFTVYPIPELDAKDTTAIYPQTTIVVRYTATDAAGGTYTYTLNGPGIDPSNPRTGNGSAANGGLIPVGTNGLNPGVYNLSVTVTSANGCTKTDDATITIYDPTTIDEPVAEDDCKGSTDPIEVNIHTTYADKYSYEVVVKGTTTHPADNYEGSATFTNKDDEPVDNTIYINVSNWAPAVYTITVKAENTVTHAEKTKSADFEIYAIPTVTLSTIPDSICEEVTTSHAIYMGGDANMTKATYSLQLSGEEKLSGDKQALDGGNLVLSTGGLTDGTYTLYVTPFSDHGCQGTEKSMTLVVCNRPTIALADPANTCENDPDYKVTITTASADAYTYAYNIYKVDGVTETAKGNGNGYVSEGSMTVKITGLEAGTYRIKATTTTKAADGGCTSAVVQPADFVIYEKPEVTKLSVAKPGVCEGTAITVSYTSSIDVKYSYKIVEKTTVNGSVDTYASSASFDVVTTDLPAAGSPYTLELITETANGCKDTATVSFAIYPIPALTGAEPVKAEDVCFGDAATTVTCTPDANVSKCTYTLKLGDEPVTEFVDKEVTLDNEGKFTINTSSLGNESTTTTYTVEVTPYSTNECHPATPYSTTFKVNRLPALSDITLDATDVCEGTATMGATFEHTAATYYKYELREQGKTDVLREGEKTGLTDGTSSISIDLLNPTALATNKTYELTVIVKNETTKCDKTKTATFYLRKNPEVTISTEQNQHHCQPVTEVTVNYSNPDSRATVFHYEVVKGTTVIKALDDKTDVSGGEWTIEFATQLLQGEYKLRVQPDNEYCHAAEWTEFVFHVDTVTPIVTTKAICYGEKFDWTVTDKDCEDHETSVTLMKGLTASTHQFDTIKHDCCNRVYELDLTVYDENLISEDHHTLCAGETYNWHDLAITEPGNYEAREPGGANGCDKIYRITVDELVPEEKSSAMSVCYGETVIFNGHEYKDLPVGKQTLSETIKSVGGCDSVYLTLDLTVGQRYYDSIVVTECDSYKWAVTGLTYSESGIYREQLATVNGCDSVFVLNLTINKSYSFNETYDILTKQLPFTVHEYTFEQAGTFDREFKSIAGCDSIYHITLNVHEEPLPKDTTVATICEGATHTWQGNDYSKEGWYSVTENDGTQDVAIHVLHLIVNEKYSHTSYVHHCGANYLWDVDGNTYDASGTYTWDGHSLVTGCDSTEILVLTLGKDNTGAEAVTACQYEPVAIGNRSFIAMENTSFDETLTNVSGCDSVVTYTVNVTPRNYTAVETPDDYCEGTTYAWRGHTYETAGIYYDTTKAGGCATEIHTLNLVSQPYYRFDEDIEVWEDALPYAWVGHKADTLLRTDGDYYDRQTTISGCDSIYHIHFHVNWVTRHEPEQKFGCGSVNWRGKDYYESGLVSDTVATGDEMTPHEIYFCEVTIYNSFEQTEPEVTLCQGTPFVWHGNDRTAELNVGNNTLTHVSPVKHNGQTVTDCDSTFTITVHVVESFSKAEELTVCPGELPYIWHGQSLSSDGDYTDVRPSPTGCDSTYTMHLTVNTQVTKPDTLDDDICLGKTYKWMRGDEQLMAIEGIALGTHTYYKWYTVPGECDSTYHMLNLTVKAPNEPILTDTVICYGETFNWIVPGCDGVTPVTLMKGLTETTHQIDTLICETNECNPIYELKLEVLPEYAAEDEPRMLCINESFLWRGGQVIDKAGTYEYVAENAADVYGNGKMFCDSVYRITVDQLIPEYKEPISQSVCYGEEVIFNNKTYTDLNVGKQTLLDTIQSVGGCDSVYLRLDLTVGQRYYDSIPVIACDKYVWEAVNGNTYTHSGIYREEYSTIDGCDSIFVLNLTINESYEFYESYDVLETELPFTVHEYSYTAAGTYDRKFTSVGGCDSIYHITLNVYPFILPKDTTEATICADAAPYSWQGNNYSASGWYSVTENDGTQDIAIHYLHLTVNKTYSDTVYVHACDSYTWDENGTTYTASTEDKVQLTSTCNCDSTIVLKLTIGNANSSTVDVTACQYEPIAVGNRSFVAMENTSFTETKTNASGCDSVITYNVTVTPREYVTPAINDAFCEGTPYVWDNTAEGGQSHTYLVAGTYYDTIADANGCATKIFTLELSAKPQYRIDEDVEVSELALPYAWRGHKGDTLLRTNGDYYDIYPATADRCDSVHHIHFHVNFVDRDTLHLTGCDSVKWDVTGEWYKTTCLVSDTVFLNDEKTLYDEIHFCNVTVNYSFEEIEPDVTICQSDAFTWHGTDYEANHFSAGDHELATDDKSVAECDSIYKVTLHVVESFRDEKTYEACPNELPYLWRGQLLTVDGDYTDVRPSPTGCDSTYIMHFTVNTHVTEPSTEHQTICQDAENPLPWQDLTIPIHTPGEYTYYHWYTVPGECDETYHRLDLTVNRSEQVGGYDTAHICYKDSYLWHGEARTVPETAATLQPDGTYATDIDAYKQNILGCDSLDAHLHLVMHTPPSPAILEDTTICNEYLWIDTLINTTGTYTKAFTTVYGCKDSTLTRHFDVFYSKTDTLDSLIACDYYRWHGQDFTKEGDTLAEYHVKQMGGTCDSIVYLPLTIHKTVRDTAKLDWWCTEFTWGETGQTYTKSDIIEGNPHKLASGCDSIPYLYLTLHDSIVEHIYDTACVTYTWDLNHMTYTGSTVDRYVEKAVTGCDSAVHWLHLTIHQPSPVTFDTLDACRSYIHKDIEYRDTTDLVLELKTIHGCDSIVRLHVNVTQPDTIYDTIRTCNIYEREGHTYLYSCDTVHEYACDSVVMLNITIDLDRDSSIWVTRWDSYEWEGDTYTESGDYEKTLQTVVGHCDSTVTLHLIINDSKDTVEKQIACESFKWEWNDSTYLLSTIDTVTLRIDEGLETERDSTRILELGIGHKKFNAFTETACDFFNWHGVQYFESQTVEYSYTDTCEGNVDTLHLTIFHKVEVEHFDTACDVLTVQGKSYFRDTTFTQQLKTVHGCDSIVNYNLIINRRQTRNISVTACDNYTWEGDTYTKSGVYTRVLTGSNGCDSVVTLNLSVRPSYHTEFDAVGCNGYYVWGNRIFDVAGDYDSIFTFDDRCDSVVTLHLSLPEKIQGPWVMDTACDEYWWNGQRYTETGYYYETFTSSTGCDSIARLDLTIAPNPRDTITETAQTRFTWGNETYYETGLYEQRFRSETGYGCDSIVTLDLTITNPLPINQIADTACDAYTWDAETFYESGVYTRNFLTPEGNDSIVKLSLVINHDVAVSDSMQLCDSVEWNGVMYYESGVYTQVLQTVAGCDSVVTMTLTVCRRDSSVFTATARDVYTWDGVDYTESGTYQRTYTSSTGCDSIVTMMLTIIHNVHVELSDTACTEYAWADSIYTHSTIHTHIFTADNGSDSVVTMTLIIHEPVYTDQFDTVRVCDPEDPSYAEYYTLPWGEQVSHTGIYCDTLTSELSQCDSIVRFHLQWCDEELCLDTTTFVVNDQCESYEWEGQTYTTSGTYTRHHRLENGCDSIVIMRLDIKPKAQTVVDITDCDSLYWKDADLWIYETGFYYDTLLAANGCDSLVIMHAVVGHKGDSILDVETCDAYTINGKTYRETGTYIQELKTTTGCDSTLTINLIVNPSVDTVVADTACDSHLWNDKTLTETGFYPLVLQSELTGCDSVVDLHLIVYGSKQVSVIDSLHCDSIVWGDAHSGIDTIYDDGIYVKTFLSTVGCDSTVTMDLRLLRHDMITAPDTAACDSFVWNGKVYYESGTYSDTLTNSFTGCDSITTMYIEINPTIRVEIEDSVPPPFYLWPTENDTIWESGVYVDTTASLVTGCDSITTLNLIMTDSIILDPQEPVRVDTFGYCPGDTMNFVYNLLKGHPTKYILLFPDISVVQEIDPKRDFIQVTDTTELPNHGLDSLFTLVIPENCEPKVYHAQLQLFDDFTSSEVYDFYIRVNYKGAIVSMWTDVVAINNFNEEFIGYQWYKDDVEIEGATKQYYSDGEDLYACYRAKLQLASDSSWIYTCEECFDLRSDSLELIAYPTPAPVGQPVTIKAMGILLEKLVGSTLTITKESGLKVDEFTLAEGQRSVDVTLTSGMYIATLVTGDADDRVRTANVKFIVF